MEARAMARYVRVTPRKARRVVDLIRGLPAAEAQAVLAFAPQSASDPVGKVLASAIANADARGGRGDRDMLWVRRAWVDEGALIAAGSDCNVSFFDPLLSIWGLVTRGTRTVGVQGPESRVDTYTAIWLYTAAGGRLLREDGRVGILAPGAFADIVGFRGDLMDDPVDDLPSRQPALTVVGGRAVHDPDALFG